MEHRSLVIFNHSNIWQEVQNLKHKHLYFQDVLSEIQRLKQEAKRFIAILSQESDDETLSPTKRQSLTREVESLQVILLCRRLFLHVVGVDTCL